MNIALVDDSAADRARLEQILKKYNSIHQLDMEFFRFSGGEAFLADYQPFRFAVTFLDIYMGGISGVETAERIRAADDDAILIFLTSSEEHRSDAFSLFASSYIIKPCTEEQVFRTMDHIFRIKTERERRFSFSFERKDYSLRYADIVSLETDGNYLSIADRFGNAYRTRMTFSAAEAQLDSRFLTLMKGIIVNMDHIAQISNDRCHMFNGAVFPLNIKNQKNLKQKWLNYKFAKIREETAAFGEAYVHK